MTDSTELPQPKEQEIITLVLKFGRHGEKVGRNQLSETDQRPAQIGQELGPQTKAYSSFAPHAWQTAEKINEGAGNTHQTRDRLALITSKLLPQEFSDALKANYDEGFDKVLASEEACALAASGTASQIEHFRQMSARLKAGTSFNLPQVTHDLEIAAFLKEALVREVDGQRLAGFTNISEIGGPFNTNEYFEVKIERTGQTETISFKFDNPQRLPGVKCELDLQKVAELAHLFNEKTKEEAES